MAGEDQRAAKALLRSQLLARRAARPDGELARAAAALRERARGCDAQLIAAFVPVRGEPGDRGVLNTLAERALVLLPVVTAIGTELGWAPYDGGQALVRGPLGLWQPRSGDAARSLHDAQVVLAPAAALTLRGDRLGQGGGFYDRALRGIDTERIVGVVHDDEVLDSLPVEPHDVRVGWVLTPSALKRC